MVNFKHVCPMFDCLDNTRKAKISTHKKKKKKKKKREKVHTHTYKINFHNFPIVYHTFINVSRKIEYNVK